MYHNDDEYPYDYTKLPRVKQLVADLDWDVLAIFDAARWDAFEKMIGNAEPVTSPGSNTPTWTSDMWCDDAYDWSDVTYISGNAITTNIRDMEKFEGTIEDHVDTYVEAFSRDDVWDSILGTARPDALTDVVAEYEPPIVVHYMQPHTPFIGNIKFGVSSGLDEYDIDELPDEDDVLGNGYDYYLAENGYIDASIVRAAYLANLELVWQHAKQLQNQYEHVIYTADHGEDLGPDNFDHGWKKKNKSRVIPFKFSPSFDPALDAPVEYGGADTHEWQYHSQPSE